MKIVKSNLLTSIMRRAIHVHARATRINDHTHKKVTSQILDTDLLD